MQTHKYRELVVIGGEKKAGRGQTEVGDLEVQTTRYKISYKDIWCRGTLLISFTITINGI